MKLFMTGINDKPRVETIVIQQQDIPLNSKLFQEIIISTDSSIRPTIKISNITEKTFDCCQYFNIQKLEIELEGGGVSAFYKCPDYIPKEMIFSILHPTDLTTMNQEGCFVIGNMTDIQMREKLAACMHSEWLVTVLLGLGIFIGLLLIFTTFMLTYNVRTILKYNKSLQLEARMLDEFES
ncbi:uncharacterized protein PvNV_100 [Penaeus vannamei nudivirus]|nr:uncharacterized protein PvSNPV_100 [Penaeus vannamei nucleopolyhedrovirus]